MKKNFLCDTIKAIKLFEKKQIRPFFFNWRGCVIIILLATVFIAYPLKNTLVSLEVIADYSHSNDMRVNFILSYGWEIVTAPIKIENVKIPLEFDNIHSEYNEIQKKAGFDLENYKGKVLKRFSYKVLNHPSKSEYVRANVFMYSGKIVAADISSTELNGFMHAICDKN